ncbi:MAG: 7-cyano-7-deazaguanine synthase QueC [Candidatus Eiseniibacteriota bacterium]
MSRRAVVLASGGLDSSTLLAQVIGEGWETFALTFDYGQRHRVEIERAAEMARSLGAAEHRVVGVDLASFGGSALTGEAAVPKGRPDIGAGIPVTYVPARNTVFLALALAWAETLSARDIFYGANALDYSGYPDCRGEFVSAFERLANAATKQGVESAEPWYRVHAPFLAMSKGEIVRRAVELGVDLSRTVSCYDPSPAGTPCGACDACILRAKGFAEAGVDDPLVAARAATARTVAARPAPARTTR